MTPEIVSRDGSLTRGLKPIGNLRLSSWLHDSGSFLEQMQRDLSLIELNLNELRRIWENVDCHSPYIITNSLGGETEVSPNRFTCSRPDTILTFLYIFDDDLMLLFE